LAKKRFLVREIKKIKRLKPSWRKPKGHHSKQRRHEKQCSKMPSVGFKKQAKMRALHPSGAIVMVVTDEKVLGSVDPKVNAVYLASGMGRRKRLKIQALADKMKIKILNRVREDDTKVAKKAGK